MPNELPNLGADVVLEFQQSINNIRLFGEALEGLDAKFGSMENRINSMRSSLNALSGQVSRGSGRNLRAEIERELNDLIAGNGIVVSKVGTAAFKVNAETVRSVFSRVEAEINNKLAEAYKNIVIQVDPSLQVGKVPIGRDDFEEVNKAIARLVRVQLNNLVAALQKHGAGLISAQDLAAIQFHIGKGTVQQIINKVKDHLKDILLKPNLGTGAQLEFTDRDLERIFNAIRNRVRESIQNTIEQVSANRETANFAENIQRLHNAVDDSAREYIRNVTQGINSISALSMTKPINQLSTQLKRFMAKELGTDLDTFNRMFAQHQFTNADINSAELRRQFARLEQALNRKIGGGLHEEVKEIIKQIESVQISYSPKLRYHLIQEINRINNQIVKKIREQIDLQFANMRAEIDSVRVAPKDINRSRRIRDLGRVERDEPIDTRRRTRETAPLASDPYARRDAYFNSFGLEGAIINTVRHILAGSIVGAPLMMLYQSVESFKTSQTEQLKMFNNLVLKDSYKMEDEEGRKTDRIDFAKVNRDIQSLIPSIKQTSLLYGVKYGDMSQVATIGSRLLDDPLEIRKFMSVAGQIKNIDQEADIVEVVAPGLEAIMAQFGLSVGELDSVVKAFAVATNVTKATTEEIMQALMRSGSTFRAAGVSAEKAIAMTAVSVQATGLSGENIGNFYKSIIPRLQSDSSLKELENIGIQVYDRDAMGRLVARSADQILEEVARKYEGLADPNKRAVIMDIFGTYQSAKGMTTLEEFEKFKEVLDAMEKFREEDFIQMMANSTQSTIVNMDRAAVSMEIAFASLMEELTPQINSVTNAITSLSDNITENSWWIAQLIDIAAKGLLGFTAWYTGRRLFGAVGAMSGYEKETKASRALETLLGRESVYGRWNKEGKLSSLSGLIDEDLLSRTPANERFMRSALNNAELRPYLDRIVAMNDEQMNRFREYLQEHKPEGRAYNLAEILRAVDEYEGYRGKLELTDEEKWGRTNFNSKTLAGNAKLKGVFADGFLDNFIDDIRDKEKFEQLVSGDKGHIYTKLAQLDAEQLNQFQKHLEEVHKSTGLVIRDLDDLGRELDNYSREQRKSIEVTRSAHPEFKKLRVEIDNINKTLSQTMRSRLLDGFNNFLNDLPNKARGAASGLATLGKGIAGILGQLVLAVGLGETISGIAYNATVSQEQRELDEAKANIKNLEQARNTLNIYKQDGFMGFLEKGFHDLYLYYGSAANFLGKVTGGDQNHYGVGTAIETVNEMMKVAKEQYGMDKDINDANAFGKWIDKNGGEKMMNQLIDTLANKVDPETGMSKLEELRKKERDLYLKQYQETQIKEEEQRILEERARAAREKDIAQKMAARDFGSLSGETIKQRIKENLEKVNAENTTQTLDALLRGMKTDSDEYIRMRREQANKLLEVYRKEIGALEEYISNLEKALSMARRLAETPEEKQQVKDMEEDLAHKKKVKEELDKEYGDEQKRVDYEGKRDVLNASLQAINNRLNDAQMRAQARELQNSLTMDRQSKEFMQASIANEQQLIADMRARINELKAVDQSVDNEGNVPRQIAALENAIRSSQVKIRELQLAQIGLYKEDLAKMDEEREIEYLQAKLRSGGMDDDSPYLRNVRIQQNQEKVAEINKVITELQAKLANTTDQEAIKTIQQEIRDLTKQSLQAQLGILDEMKNTGGTFNLPDNVKAMSYYEYITRNNTHTTYTVQGGDTHVTITLPNITDGTSIERIRQIGRAFGEGIHEGKNLRLQKQANPFGYRG